MSRRATRARRVGRVVAAGIVAGFVAGCSTTKVPEPARVVRAPAPTIAADRLAAPLSDSDKRLGWSIAPPDSFSDQAFATFAAAREAYWSYDAGKAAQLLQTLREHDGIADEHFYFLYLTCFESAGRWAETLPMYEKFGIHESHEGWRKWAEFRATVPPLAVEFAVPAPAVPFTLRLGSLVATEVTVNGTKARVMLDTGANSSWWSRSFAKRAGLQSLNRTIALKDSNERARPANLVLMRELQLGGCTVRNALAISGSAWLFQFSAEVDGIIGWDVLQHAHLVFDFPARQLTIGAPSGRIPEQPILSGRVAPILTVRSAEGMPLHLFFDSGATSNRTGVELHLNDGVIDTKVATKEFRRGWRPTFSAGLHSFSISWPRRTRPFAFWMDGHRFETDGASLSPGEHTQEQLAYRDGLVGNGPFLGGKLTICGVRRLAQFELTTVTP